jgi:hypothetical protein
MQKTAILGTAHILRARSGDLEVQNMLKLLETKRNVLYLSNQSVPRCKHFPTSLHDPLS